MTSILGTERLHRITALQQARPRAREKKKRRLFGHKVQEDAGCDILSREKNGRRDVEEITDFRFRERQGHIVAKSKREREKRKSPARLNDRGYWMAVCPPATQNSPPFRSPHFQSRSNFINPVSWYTQFEM